MTLATAALLSTDPERYPHGTRARYTASKCRCTDCRAANLAYHHATKNRGALISTDGIIGHMRTLSAHGVGHRAVSDAAKVGRTIIRKILSGEKTLVREAFAKQILAVTVEAKADGARVPAKETWKAITRILGYGYTKAEIAERLGNVAPHLILGKKFVLLRTQRAVLDLLEEVVAEMAAVRKLDKLCMTCGLSHEKEERQKLINRLTLPMNYKEVSELYPCIYPMTNTALQSYIRDCIDIGKWHYPRAAKRPARLAREQVKREQRQAQAA